eukprot:jgi/Galph1/2811/GphlegSOOS_G1456.1
MSETDSSFQDNQHSLLLTQQTLSIDDACRQVACSETGAIASFCGITRECNQGKQVSYLEYEAYTPMVISELKNLSLQIRKRWNVQGIAIWHRVGRVDIGETSVIVAISSEHRKEALEACSFAIDKLKASVPIWKKEYYTLESSQWLANKEFGERFHATPNIQKNNE